jgi:hypothetical protein
VGLICKRGEGRRQRAAAAARERRARATGLLVGQKAARVWLGRNWPRRLVYCIFFFSFLLKMQTNIALNNSKILIIIPKLFITKIFIFGLIIIILFIWIFI